MFTREDLENVVLSIKETVGTDMSALISESLLSVISNYQLALEQIEELTKTVEELTDTNEELLKVNGKLFQQIGFEKKEEEEVTPEEEEVAEVEELTVEDVIDEKGDII